MRVGFELATVDKQFLKVIDYLKEKHSKERENVHLTEDAAFGKLIYPTNRYFIEKMRKEGKSVPHLALIKLAEHFNIDYNYFYEEHADVRFKSGLESSKTANAEIARVQMEEGYQRALEDFQKKLNLLETGLRSKKKSTVDFLLDETEALVKACKELMKQNKDRIAQKGLRNALDHVISYMQLKFEQTCALDEFKDRASKDAEELKNGQTKMEELRQQIALLYKDVMEANKTALHAREAESEALKQLLALKE